MDMDILDLPGLKALQVIENEHGDYRIMAETTSPPFSCPECGSSVIGFGKKEQLFMDLPTHGRRTGIVVIRKRYRVIFAFRLLQQTMKPLVFLASQEGSNPRPPD
jgi:transposase